MLSDVRMDEAEGPTPFAGAYCNKRPTRSGKRLMSSSPQPLSALDKSIKISDAAIAGLLLGQINATEHES